MSEFAIFGAAGAIGRAVGAELERRKLSYRVVGRTRRKLAAAFPSAEVIEADLALAAGAAAAAHNARIVIYAIGVPYNAFHLHPVLMQNALDAAAAEGIERVVVVSSVYSYGRPQTPLVTEDHPRQPVSRKGALRKQQEDAALAAHGKRGLHTLVLHLPDFYGPYADLSIANPIFEAAVSGKRAVWLGSPDLPHEFLFVPDAGPVIVDLALRGDVWGQRWNLGGVGAITAREFISSVFREVGREPKFQSVRKSMLRLAGIFNPFLREVAEMFYLQETPLILDDSKLRQRLGELQKTPYAEGIRQTVAWAREKKAAHEWRRTH